MAWLPRPWSPFRQAQNSLERRVRSEPEAVVLQQSTVWVRGITWSLMGLSAFALGWLALAKTEEIVTVPGKLEPLGVVKDVQMPVGGVVKSVLIKEGDSVKQGQVLLRLDTEASRDRQRSIRETIRHKQSQLQLKDAELRRSLELNSTEQAILRRSLILESEVLQRLEILNREGAAAELQFLQQRNKVQEVQGKLEQSAADRLRQEAILNQGLQELAGQLAELRTSLIELNVNIRYQEVRSPVAGLVFNLKPTGSGFVAQTSEPVMKIVPFDKLEARVEIPSASIGFVQVGQPVDVSIDSFPASDFGVLSGTVRRIGSDALPPDSLKQTYRFPADIRLDSQQLQLKSGQDLPLQVGMSLTANIKLRKVTYLQLLLSDFKNRADSLRRI